MDRYLVLSTQQQIMCDTIYCYLLSVSVCLVLPHVSSWHLDPNICVSTMQGKTWFHLKDWFKYHMGYPPISYNTDKVPRTNVLWVLNVATVRIQLGLPI